jgi:hypothetical protein
MARAAGLTTGRPGASMRVRRSIDDAIRKGLDWHARWAGPDRGLVACWERGRELALEDPALAARAREGRLVVLPWKGGLERPVKAKRKVGTLRYLAMWRGLRGEDLDLDLSEEPSLVCSATSQTVLFTDDLAKYANA